MPLGVEGGYKLLLRCDDVPGIVAAVAGFVERLPATIVDSSHFLDRRSGKLCMRLEFYGLDGTARPVEEVAAAFEPIAARFSMTWRMHGPERVKTLIMVSRFGHCLFDLIHDWRAGLLPIDITAVVSNHADLADFVDWAGLPFHHLPVTPATKASSEAALGDVLKATGTELVVLARYMQVLSPELCRTLDGRCINIHHGFLPSFKGAKPYHQAYDRGVKVIGATAHFVTTDLDEGPIIEQDTGRIDHSLSPEELIVAGRDLESAALRRAVVWFAQRRIMQDGCRTIIFK